MEVDGVLPVATLKRKQDTSATGDYFSCLLCQEGDRHNEKLSLASADGKKKIQQAAAERRRLKDRASLTTLNRLMNITDEDWTGVEMKWHKTCYINFASESRLCRLRDRRSKEHAGMLAESSTTTAKFDEQIASSSYGTRKYRHASVEWEHCIFCQRSGKGDLHSVMTMQVSQKIIDLSKEDFVMSVRMANVVDLIAAEGKYHKQCFVEFERRVNKTKERHSRCSDPVLNVLGDILLEGLSVGNMYDMGTAWERYVELCSAENQAIPDSYMSRRQTFYTALQNVIGDKGSFIRPRNRKAPLLLYPSDNSQYVIACALSDISDRKDNCNEDDAPTIREQLPSVNELQEIVHSALQLRADLERMPGHDKAWRGLTADAVEAIVPDSLYLFLSVLFGGSDVLETGTDDQGEIETSANAKKQRILNIAQDIVFALSKGKKLTPKHVGLGMTLHQATRSEKLVDLFHAAGATICVNTVRRMDTSIANDILLKFDENNNTYIPDGLVPYEPGRLILGSADNIDVNESTVSGQGTFHCTQWNAWQRGPPPPRTPVQRLHGREKTLRKETVEKLHDIDPPKLPIGTRVEPRIPNASSIEPNDWFKSSPCMKAATRINHVWVISRMDTSNGRDVPPWAAFNECVSTVDSPLTTVGMAPILNATADEYGTITTIINRFIQLSRYLGQRHAIVFFDQPLYAKAKEIVWASEEYSNVVVLLGGLHITFNFLRAIGQQMENAGLDDVWVESEIFGQNAVKSIMDGKHYYRAIQGHIWAYEALSRIKFEAFLDWLQQQTPELHQELVVHRSAVSALFQKHGARTRDECLLNAVTACNELLDRTEYVEKAEEFHTMLKQNSNNAFWLQYLEMVEILFSFVRANRDGDWLLHLDSFAAMLPWLTIYDHVNYARWGPVYLADMRELAQTSPEVHEEFLAGNFVVKRHAGRFNQVPVDQATEWVNKVCKLSNGIIGITRNDTARDRFCTTWSERSQISEDTLHLFGLCNDDSEGDFSTRKDGLPSKMTRDWDAMSKLEAQFRRFKVFTTFDQDNTPLAVTQLKSLTTNDIATEEIAADLLTANERGKDAVLKNVKERLVEKSVPFFHRQKKQKSKTFATLYETPVQDKKQKVTKTIKADRQLMQRLFNASQAGRVVDLHKVLKHELSAVPSSLANTDKTMHSTQKSALLPLLTTGLGIEKVKGAPETTGKTCIIIDGHALIQSLGKPPKCKTFGDYANTFKKTVVQQFRGTVSRIDVVFDQYRPLSIKSTTRSKRAGQTRPIRKVINRDDLPLPQAWTNFIALGENKEDLALYLSGKLATHNDTVNEIVVGGSNPNGFSTTKGIIAMLNANHEEADTRIILHALEAIDASYDNIIVKCRDTDVLLLLLHFTRDKLCQVWMMSGTSKEQESFPVHVINKTLLPAVVENVLGFHAITGCDTVSSFSGHGKKSCWNVYLQHPELLHGVGRDGLLGDVEKFVCMLYKSPHCGTGVDRARHDLFQKGKKVLEMLPPTSDALELHMSRANYQAKVWLQANKTNVLVPDPEETGGWQATDRRLEVVWLRKPSVPTSCVELVTCGCKSKCRTQACLCHKMGQPCIPACGCDAEGCMNTTGDEAFTGGVQ